MKKRPYLLAILIALIVGTPRVIEKKLYRIGNLGPMSYVTLVGPIEMADGIGRQTVELASVLLEDFTVNIIANHRNMKDVPKHVRFPIKKRDSRLGNVVIFEESLWAPGHDISRILQTLPVDNQIRIAYSMLESTKIPAEWVMQLNLYYDAVVVPDPCLAEVYKNSGVTLPIFTIPLGLDLKKALSSPLKAKRNEVMVFGNLSSALDRKNQVMLVRAFATAFGNSQKVALLINCRNGDDAGRQALIEEIAKHPESNILFTEFKLSNDAYLKLFKSLDCYVSLSKGEGFSIQPREAMALGIPVIATDNLGQTTICNSGVVRRVESSIKEPAFYFGRSIATGFRFNCKEEDVVEALKDLYEHYDHYLSFGEKARLFASNYDYENPHVKALYKTLVRPKHLVLGEENRIEEDTLITDSPELYKKYYELGNK